MSVGKISSARLAAVFAGLSDGQSQATRQVEPEGQPDESSNSEAVKLSKGLESNDRAEKVKNIKQMVEDGTYFSKVKTEDIARSVMMGLFS